MVNDNTMREMIHLKIAVTISTIIILLFMYGIYSVGQKHIEMLYEKIDDNNIMERNDDELYK